MTKKVDRRPVQLMITTGEGSLRVRATRLIPGRKFVAFANQLEAAIERLSGPAHSYDGKWHRDGRTWIIPGPFPILRFISFVGDVGAIAEQSALPLELLPVQYADLDDSVVLPAPGVASVSKKRRKAIEDTIAQIEGELAGGRILAAKAIAKLGAAYDRRGVELPAEVFRRVATILRKASPPTGSAG